MALKKHRERVETTPPLVVRRLIRFQLYRFDIFVIVSSSLFSNRLLSVLNSKTEYNSGFDNLSLRIRVSSLRMPVDLRGYHLRDRELRQTLITILCLEFISQTKLEIGFLFFRSRGERKHQFPFSFYCLMSI